MRTLGVVAGLALLASCAGLLGTVIDPPRFSVPGAQQAELRLVGPTLQNPLGGATIRLWARVENPNAFGFTLANVAGSLFLEGARAAGVDLPLGLPLRASQDTIIPIDLAIRFSDVPGLADVAVRAFAGQPIGYRFDGTVAVNAGALGRPTFGPSTLLQGQMETRR